MGHRKQRVGAPPGFFACEAAGLDWLRVPGGPPVVEVLDVADDHLDLVRLTEVGPDRAKAEDFGRRLAVLHDAGAPAFGSPPEGWHGDGFFGPLDQPLPMPTGAHDSWGEFLAVRRLEPLRDLLPAEDAHALDPLIARLRSSELDDDDSPARLHGDLWSGNVLWTADGATLIDPAAHGGHRESDLAMLALFGCPHLDAVLAGYQAVHPLRRGWQHRRSLHQVYPVGMHVVLFGGGYRAQLHQLLAAIPT
ncbi:fructosamine kinase family protein [Cellulomonas sp. NPDC089187]|uniref:fructosamine kinase family protein n=1 Tax=Cellulomonas sp. NPDC089187 TaxID=3154970 RepID=UPI0034213E49